MQDFTKYIQIVTEISCIYFLNEQLWLPCVIYVSPVELLTIGKHMLFNFDKYALAS